MITYFKDSTTSFKHIKVPFGIATIAGTIVFCWKIVEKLLGKFKNSYFEHQLLVQKLLLGKSYHLVHLQKDAFELLQSAVIDFTIKLNQKYYFLYYNSIYANIQINYQTIIWFLQHHFFTKIFSDSTTI